MISDLMLKPREMYLGVKSMWRWQTGASIQTEVWLVPGHSQQCRSVQTSTIEGGIPWRCVCFLMFLPFTWGLVLFSLDFSSKLPLKNFLVIRKLEGTGEVVADAISAG